MSVVCDYILIFLICGLGVSLFFFGIQLHKEAFVYTFSEHDYILGILFTLGAFILDIVGLIVFYGGWYLKGRYL